MKQYFIIRSPSYICIVKLANQYIIYLIFILLGMTFFTACKRDNGLVSYEGRVINSNEQPVSNAEIRIYTAEEDWLTGENTLLTLHSDADGYFRSEKAFEPGEYFIYIQKLDSSNWYMEEVDQGIFPKISIPKTKETTFMVIFNHMVGTANTRWILTNVHQEFSKPNHSIVEWKSIWNQVNNCRRDNEVFFNKDMSLRISEGNTVCSGSEHHIFASFSPPDTSTVDNCILLLHTAQQVREFGYMDWPQMQAIGARLFLSCNESLNQFYVLYPNHHGIMTLDVYSPSN